MSLQLAAQHLATKGRGEDSMLVHMTPKEVKGLQALAMKHGGSLTVNPETGLVEAGFLKNLLPALVGVGLSIASGGTLTPMMIAGGVGGLTALSTGSLSKGLMAGLGAYGGAGLGAGLAGAGAEAALAGGEAARQAAIQGAGAAGLTEAQAVAMQNADILKGVMANPSSAALTGAGSYLTSTPGMWKAAQVAAPAMLGAMETKTAMPGTPEEKFDPKYYDYKPNYGSDYSDGTDSRERTYMAPSFQERPGYAGGGLVELGNRPIGMRGIASLVGDIIGKVSAGQGAQPNYRFDDGTIKYSFDPEVQSYTQLQAPAVQQAATQGQGGLNRFGGANWRNPQAQTQPDRLRSGIGRLLPTTPAPEGYAEGGSLGSYSDGGQMLKGPGDGVSDSIPAHINGKQPAKLADNEFVIPARIVSEIGNGSSDAGAKRLYAMMERIQARRGKTVGKGKVAVDSKAYEELPA